MTFYSFLLFLLPILIGFFCVHLLWPESNAYLLKFALGIGVGLGLVSLLYFVFLLFFAGHSGFFVILLVLLAALVIASFKSLKRTGFSFSLPKLSWIQIALLIGLMIVTTLAAATLVSATLRRPHGGFDAWLIWNRASRFIYRGGADWKTAFSPSFYFFFEAGYPLSLPLTNAWAWEVLKNETLRVPFMQGAIYLFGIPLLLFGALAYTRSFAQAALATGILLGTMTYLQVGSAQMADVPLAMLILAAVVSLYLYFKSQNARLLALAGFFSGLSAWVKNEGMTFMLFSALACGFLIYKDKDRIRKAGWYLAGLAFPLVIVLYFKLALAPASGLLSDGIQGVLRKVVDPSRYIIIWNAVLNEFHYFGGWRYIIPILLLYLIVAYEKQEGNVPWYIAVIAILFLQVLGYLGVYLITPYPLQFHITDSFDRILLHVYPAMLFILFSATATPEKIFSSPQINPQ